MNIEQGIMNVEGSKVEIRMNELENSVFVRIPNHYSLFLVQYSLFPLLGIKTAFIKYYIYVIDTL